MKALNKIFALAVLITLAGLGAAARDTETQRLVSAYARKEPLRSGILGVLAVRGADTLAQYNKGLKMVPASNVKLITTGLALQRLGPDMRFKTTLAYKGTLDGGVLEGDLYIVGGGDPTTGAGSGCADSLEVTFSAWKSILDDAGIKTVKGRVIGDPRLFKRPAYGLSWQNEDLGYNYGAGPAGLNFFENSQCFAVSPSTEGSPLQIVLMYPDTPWMSYSNNTVTGLAHSSNTLYCINTDYGPFCEFRGSFPSHRTKYKLECSNRYGAYTCAYFFHNYLLCNGIMVEGGFADISPYGHVRSDLLLSDIGEPAAGSGELIPLGSASSPELRRIVRDTNYNSDNFYAETMFNMLSLSMFGSADRDSSANAAKRLLSNMGLQTDNACKLVDGSGLSRKNYVSPEFFVRFLKKMYNSPLRDCYVSSLPSPGTKSTLKRRLGRTPEAIKSRVKMKSGSMDGVLCFSGYILPADGDRSKTIFFSLLTNNVTAPGYAVGTILDEIIVSLATEP